MLTDPEVLVQQSHEHGNDRVLLEAGQPEGGVWQRLDQLTEEVHCKRLGL